MSDDETNALQQTDGTNAIYQPNDWKEAKQMAKHIYKSGLCPHGINGPEDAFVVMATGADLGLSPMESLRGIYVVKGRPTLSADLMVALVRRSPDCKYFHRVELTDDRCTYETKRTDAPEPQSFTYTMQMARKANLTGKGVWQSHPKAMLRARAASRLAREEYPEAMLGLYTPEEGQEISDSDEPAIEAQVIDAEVDDDPVDGPMRADDAKCQKLTERIRELLDEVYEDVDAIAGALDAELCKRNDVDAWRWVSTDALTSFGRKLSNHSATGGRRSERRLHLDRLITADDYEPAKPVDWTATADADDCDREALSKRWHSVARDKLDDLLDDYRAAMKARHDVDSFKALTSAQIMEEVGALERLSDEADEPGGMSPVDEYAMDVIDQYGAAHADEVAELDEEVPSKADELAATVREILDTDDEAEAVCRWIVEHSSADTWDSLPDAAADQWLDTIVGKDDPAGWMRSKITDAAAE